MQTDSRYGLDLWKTLKRRHFLNICFLRHLSQDIYLPLNNSVLTQALSDIPYLCSTHASLCWDRDITYPVPETVGEESTYVHKNKV